MRHRCEAASVRDLGDAAIVLSQEHAGLGDAQVVHVIGKGFAGETMETAAEGAGADMQDRGGFIDARRAVQMLADPDQQRVQPTLLAGIALQHGQRQRIQRA